MRFRIQFLVLLLVISVFTNCARRGSPTGGPKDSIPPVMEKAIPKMESINFDEKKIKIYFDEYIKLKDLNQNLIISPPQKYDPVVYPVGTASKFISIKILDTLDANTTYQFNFGKAVVDNNEENELGNFKYVFSTGSHIDSLILKGKVIDPAVKESAKGLDVMLYRYDSTYTDSIVFKEKPRYITNTLDSTLYELTNLKAGKYLLMALKDGNNNKIFDPKTDKIGFINDTVTLPLENELNFSVFKEVLDFKAIRPIESNKGHIIFGYEGDPKGMKIELLSEAPNGFKAYEIFDITKDTLNYWYKPFEADSLNFRITNTNFDEEFTVKLRKKEIDSLSVNPNISGTLHYLDTLILQTSTPIVSFNKSLVKITKQVDTITENLDFDAILSNSRNKISFLFDKKFDSQYSFEMLPKSITDIHQLTNDSISINLNTLTPEDYGIINVDIVSNEDASFIIELLNDKEQIVRTKVIENPQTVVFDYLSPKIYVIRATIDKNRNGKWDTGNFLQKKQPEKIVYYQTEIELRANFEMNETFNLDE
jgi:uncharacterized protein (DUF2141 family)